MNYQLELDRIINSLENKVPTLLLHSCCAPCSTYVIEYLSAYFKITILYYNPNIEPVSEYIKRKKEQIKFIEAYKGLHKVDYIDIDYDNESFKNVVIGLENEKEGGSRCSKCYRLRLEKTAIVASENNYDYFTTTLTVSPYKHAKTINDIGLELEKNYKVKYMLSDFKKKEGYKKSIELSKKYNLYRQDYCGCLFSKRDNYID